MYRIVNDDFSILIYYVTKVQRKFVLE